MKIKILTAAACLLAVGSCKTGKDMTKAEYSGKDMTGVAGIVRDKQTKQASFSINKDMRWELYAGRSVDSIDFTEPVAEGKKAGEYILDVPGGVRFYFQLVTPEGNAILSERQLPMAGGYNFRDLGGMRTKDGRYVKWGRIFRSDDLFALTEQDLAYLSSIPIVSVVDFRADDEVSRAPDLLPESVEHVYAYSVEPGNLVQLVGVGTDSLTADRVASFMEEMNRMMVTDPEVTDQYRKFFALLADDANMPLMFHCSAGKDRTGLGAALILLSLGVDEQDVIDDYLFSNTCLADKYAGIMAENPLLEPLMEVRAGYLKAALDKIREVYGSADAFLTEELGVDLEFMREEYLY